MARHASTQLPAMQCTQRLDPALLDELIVETRSIEELDLDGASVSPFLRIDVREKPPVRLDLSDIEIVEAVVIDRPSRALSAEPGGTVSHARRRWWLACGALVAGAAGVAIWVVS